MPIGKVYEGHSFQSETKPSAKKYLNDEAIYEVNNVIFIPVTYILINFEMSLKLNCFQFTSIQK